MKFPKPVKRVKARKPLQRGKRLRPRGNTKHARRERDFEYMTWIKTRPCIARLMNVQGVDCAGAIEANHVGGRYGADSDRRCVPMCHKHHEDWTGRVGGGGIFAGWTPARRRTWGAWAIEYTRLEYEESQRPFIGIDRGVSTRLAPEYIKDDGPTLAEIIADASERK